MSCAEVCIDVIGPVVLVFVLCLCDELKVPGLLDTENMFLNCNVYTFWWVAACCCGGSAVHSAMESMWKLGLLSLSTGFMKLGKRCVYLSLSSYMGLFFPFPNECKTCISYPTTVVLTPLPCEGNNHSLSYYPHFEYQGLSKHLCMLLSQT